ncbi:hypothetical protein [Methylobacterium tarhaniae]|uniref:hypothetical protein n=1 Tax=Methylobacterium tarhaniae TaxID=1187852 RepID=UPI003CFE4D84
MIQGHTADASGPTLTPALRRVLQVLVRADGPHTYVSLGAEIERSPKSVEKTMRALQIALAETGITISRRRHQGESAMRLSVAGDRLLIGRLLGEPPAIVQAAAQRVDVVTLPSVGGISYAFSAEGRLIVDGVVQPARAA